MASIDFPSSPTDGQTLTSGNATYTYVAAKGYWDAIAATSGIQLTSLSVGPEGSPSGNGDISYDNTTGVFTYTPPVISTFDGIITLGTITEKTSLPVAATETIAGLLAERAKIQSSDAQASDRFGRVVSISSDGNTAIIGAVFEDTGGVDAGAAYIFTKSGSSWSQQAKIQASDKQEGDNFGTSVSISSDGNTAIAGAYFEDTGANNRGSAYVFVRSGTTWTQQAKLAPSVTQTNMRYGGAVDISSDGNTAIVGAYGDQGGASTEWTGAVYIYVRSGTTWSQQARIIDNVAGGYFFGSIVSISGDGLTVAVGVGQEPDPALYIFAKSGTTWSQQAKITGILPGDLSTGLGVSVSSDGNTIICGASREDTGATDAGAAYIFTRSGTTWSQQAKIQASDKEASDLFGSSVSISDDGNTVIVGARTEDTGGVDAGAAYIFKRFGTTWTETQKIQASDIAADDNFSWSVSISGDGNTAIVGSEQPPYGTAPGSAYMFEAEIEVGVVFAHDISQSSIFTHSGLTADFTANFTNVPTTNNRTTEIELVIEQGATGYLPAAIQIDSAAEAFVWENGTTPDPSINASDIVKFTLIRSEGAWTVLASLTRFTDAAYPAPLTLTDLSVGAEAAASGDGGIAYDNSTGVFTYTPPVISGGGIALTDFSVGAEAAASGDGAISYDNTTGVFTYTPPVITGGIALTDFSVGAEAAASGDGAISYDNTTGVFTYTPPVITGGVNTASVEAAGALMDSELTNIIAVKALNQSLSTTDSPSFAGLTLSGIPTAPTAPPDTNTTQIATTEFITTAINELNVTAANFVNRIYDGDGVTNTFVVTSGVTSESILVSDNGVVQRPVTDYSVSGTTLTFVSAPLTGSTIQIREIPAGISGAGIALASLSVGAAATASGDGSIAYDNTTGVFTYTPPVIPSNTLFTDLTTFAATTEIAAALTGATGVVAHDITSSSLFIHSSVAANFTANFTNVPTTNDRTVSVALIINQGATGYLPTDVQIDGVAQTILWQGSTTPTAGTSATDIASFTLIRSGSAWTVIGTVTAFGAV